MSDFKGKKPPAATPEAAKTGWSARGVTGIVPPGRRLGDAGEKRRAAWSGTNVVGVAPPGNQAADEGPAVRWAVAKSKGLDPNKREAPGGKKKSNKQVASTETFEPNRPTAGFVPDLSASDNDPKDLKTFLDLFAEEFKNNAIDDESAKQLSQLVGQSHAPFEILIGFTILTAWVGTDGAKRKAEQWSLERGAKVYFNLAKRLDPNVRPPRGLVPKTVDPLFFDLPASTFQMPYAYSVDAYLRIMELCRADHVRNKKLVNFAHALYDRFIEKRSYGDRALTAMFPWTPPPWAPT